MLAAAHTVEIEADPERGAVPRGRGRLRPADRVARPENFDGLRLCSQVRSLDRTRNVPILAIADAEDNTRLVRGLEIGVNDYLIRPIDKNELMARVRTQIRKKRYAERLRDNVQMSIEMAITDALTGLYNRRYMETPSRHAGRAGAVARQAAVGAGARHRLLQVDQRHLRPRRRRRRAARVRDPDQKSIRGIDLACRYGGEEFVVVMPETDMAVATMVAERLRRRIAERAVPDPAGRPPGRGHDLDRDRRARTRRGRRRGCSSGPIRRSTGPSATGATGWCRRRLSAAGADCGTCQRSTLMF